MTAWLQVDGSSRPYEVTVSRMEWERSLKIRVGVRVRDRVVFRVSVVFRVRDGFRVEWAGSLPDDGDAAER